MSASWFQALVLGIVQGLTEFIPVSSSGHLVLVPYLMGWEKHSLAFDVMLHTGTLLATLLYFRGELTAIVRGILRLDTSPEGQVYRRVGLFILPASVPIGLVGLLLADHVEGVFSSPLTASLLLLVTAGLLLSMEAVRRQRTARTAPVDVATAAGQSAGPTWDGSWRAEGAPVTAAVSDLTSALPLGVDPEDPQGTTLAGLTLRQAMTIGLLQCLAVLPGVSRSGTTIAAGVFAGLTREAATRFSFLLVIPALLGATVLSVPDLAERGGETAAELAIGITAAFVSGYLAIRFLVGLVSRERLNGFAYYCIAASVVGVVGYLMIGPVSSV